MARPRKVIAVDAFEKLCFLQCTLMEIASYFDCSEDTVERWCQRTYGERFADVYKKKRAAGMISLRRSQFRLAEKSVPMAIFLGKNYLGQSDKIEAEDTTAIDKLDAILSTMKEKADANADAKSEAE